MPCIKMPSCAHAAATPCNHYVGLQFCCLGCGLFDMIGGKQTCGLQVRSTFNPPEAVRRAAPSQVASSNLVSRTTSSQAMYRLRRHFYALHPNVVVRSRRCDSFQNCNHHVGLQFCCLGCGLFDMFAGN